jgi:hypothetical protein
MRAVDPELDLRRFYNKAAPVSGSGDLARMRFRITLDLSFQFFATG